MVSTGNTLTKTTFKWLNRKGNMMHNTKGQWEQQDLRQIQLYSWICDQEKWNIWQIYSASCLSSPLFNFKHKLWRKMTTASWSSIRPTSWLEPLASPGQILFCHCITCRQQVSNQCNDDQIMGIILYLPVLTPSWTALRPPITPNWLIWHIWLHHNFDFDFAVWCACCAFCRPSQNLTSLCTSASNV